MLRSKHFGRMIFHLFWITALFCCLTLYLLIDRHRTQQAMGWWQKQQVERLHQETEVMRDQVLQDLFSLRRHLELMTILPSASSEAEQMVIVADRCHQTLAQLGDRLFSPYAIESLAIAIQELVAIWEKNYPQSTFSYTTVESEAQPTSQNYQFLLIWLDELCRGCRPQQHPLTFAIKLKQEDSHHEIEIHLSQATEMEPAIPTQLIYLCRIFRILQGGQCQLSQTGSQCRLWLKW
jgi:hypothetical protein